MTFFYDTEEALKDTTLYVNVKFCLWHPKLYQILEFLPLRVQRKSSPKKVWIPPILLPPREYLRQRQQHLHILKIVFFVKLVR